MSRLAPHLEADVMPDRSMDEPCRHSTNTNIEEPKGTMNELHNPKRELHRRASCTNNLKQIGFSLKLAPVSILLLGIATFLPLAAPAQSSDGTDQFLLQVAAPNRTVGSDDRPNVLFIIVDDLNVALGSYLDSRSLRVRLCTEPSLQSISRFYPEWPQTVFNRHSWQRHVLADQTRRRLALATRAFPRSGLFHSPGRQDLAQHLRACNQLGRFEVCAVARA